MRKISSDGVLLYLFILGAGAGLALAHRETQLAETAALQVESTQPHPTPEPDTSSEVINLTALLSNLTFPPNSSEPVRLKLAPGVHDGGGEYFQIPTPASLELQGEPGTQIRSWIVRSSASSSKLTVRELELLSVRILGQAIMHEVKASKVDVHTEHAVAVTNSTLNNSDIHSDSLNVIGSTLNDTRLVTGSGGSWSLESCTLSGQYRLDAWRAKEVRVRNSQLGPCEGACVDFRRMDNASFALHSSTVQTSIDFRGRDSKLDLRDLTVLNLRTAFVQVSQGSQLDIAMYNVTLRNVWSAVKIATNGWKLSMHKVTVTRAMLAGVSLQSFAGDGSTVELHDVRMEDVLGTAVVMDGNISATVTNTTFEHCNAGITTRDAALQLTEVDMLGDEKRGVGLTLTSSSVRARDIRTVDLAAGLVLSGPDVDVDMKDVFLTDNALGIVATKSTGSIHGLTYFNDAMDELCAGGGGCPTVVHRDLFMQYNFRSFMAACLAGCLVSTLSAVQLLKLLYTDLGLSWYTALWALGCSFWPWAIVASVKVLFAIRVAVHEQEAKPRGGFGDEYLSPEIKMIRCFVLILLWSTCGVAYVCFDVLRNRHSLVAFGDLKRKQKLMDKQDALKKRLDDPTVRDKLHTLHEQLFAAAYARKEDQSKQIFEEMKSLAEKALPPLAKWFVDQRTAYEEEDDGARMRKLSMIKTVSREAALQPALEEHHCGSRESAVDALRASASWLRADFKRQLSEMVQGLNDVSREQLRKFDEQLTLDSSLHQLQPEPGAEYGKHLGLLVAPIKSKERALAKIQGDYEKDDKKTERPSARYVCDFLRATIYAADPFALAFAFQALEERFKIVRVKNKFADESLKAEERTNILVNLWVEGRCGKQIGEVQFLMQEYLTAKSLQHMYYDVARATDAQELFDKPIFR
ncbi:unnamed protein product [Symbiodinium natans]|uniref:Right handed beta helix domain-containing protein n=1 Tax=Symbiodinium natans TaxID=878477 RepID=A0A812PKW2_9DINO|nr:unnamed protein product [Symbiodinium natans]